MIAQGQLACPVARRISATVAMPSPTIMKVGGWLCFVMDSMWFGKGEVDGHVVSEKLATEGGGFVS